MPLQIALPGPQIQELATITEALVSRGKVLRHRRRLLTAERMEILAALRAVRSRKLARAKKSAEVLKAWAVMIDAMNESVMNEEKANQTLERLWSMTDG